MGPLNGKKVYQAGVKKNFDCVRVVLQPKCLPSCHILLTFQAIVGWSLSRSFKQSCWVEQARGGLTSLQNGSTQPPILEEGEGQEAAGRSHAASLSFMPFWAAGGGAIVL